MLKTVHPPRRQRHLQDMDSGLRWNDTVDVAGQCSPHKLVDDCATTCHTPSLDLAKQMPPT